MFELNPESAKGFSLRGSIRMHRADPRGAMEDFKRALVLDRNDPEALLWLGYGYAVAGRVPMARALMDRLQQVDPLTSINQTMCGIVAMFDGKYDEALRWTQRSVDVDPANPTTRMMHAHALAANGRVDEARGVLQTIAREKPTMAWARLACAMAFALGGDREQVLTSITSDLREAAEWDDIFSWWMADCYALVGEREAALDCVRRMIELGMFNYPFLAHHEPFLGAIRSEPRFVELMERARKLWDSFEP
jgi:Flp pilus assembly protein TadD